MSYHKATYGTLPSPQVGCFPLIACKSFTVPTLADVIRDVLPLLVRRGLGGALSLVLFFWDGRRIWGWRLEVLAAALRARRGFRWTTIPWDRIRDAKSMQKGRQGSVVIELASQHSEQLGTFTDSFARKSS